MTDFMLEDSVYLVLQRDRFGMKVAEMRKNKPAMRAGQIAVKVRLRIPRKAFEEFIPSVVATIGENDVFEPKVEVIPRPVDES